ncbi:MAG: serine/threonine protein kinase psk1 [Bathelium mastoideum]|nr:MAG: serine/threonine protein kinase psk1 [Bathelium mastoideum]
METQTGIVTGVRASTPPIHIASPALAKHAVLSPPPDNPGPKLDIDAVRVKAAKKKKKKRNNGLPAAPAATTIYGFQTPVTSAGEESDYSTAGSPRLGARTRNLPSVTSSPSLNAVANGGAGVSALKLQLDALNLQNGTRPSLQRSSSKLRSDISSPGGSSRTMSDGDRTEMDSYEVPLEDDFVSPELSSKPILGVVEGGLRQNSIVRKMTASDFEPLTCLGKGTFGTVLLVKQRATGRLYAQKQFRKASLTVHKKLVEQTKTERVILESINRHPYVVKLFYAFQDHEKLYLILEYAQGGELFTHLATEKMFSEEVAAFYMAEMILALEHLHANVGVVYRDLKPENCLLDSEGHLLLTDFGLSKVAIDDDTRCNSILGTIEYMAPEVIQGQDYGMAVDYWSLGAIGFDLLTGGPPFTGPNHAKIQDKILKAKLVLPYFLGPDAKDLLTRLLRKEPKKRLGANMPKDLQTIKKQRFFRKIDWQALERRELEPPIKPLITDPELAENFSRDFTELAISPVATTGGKGFEDIMVMKSEEGNVFGGFSFVASQSLLDSGEWGF